MQEACTEFVDSCKHCQRMKNRTQRAFGTMAEVEEPESMGIAYSVDFLTRLAPATAGGFDCLMVIVDRWSRRVFTIPCHATTTAQKAAELFYEEICLHLCRGIPIWLQMDRDPRFTSAWFREFCRLTGGASAFHHRLQEPEQWAGRSGKQATVNPVAHGQCGAERLVEAAQSMLQPSLLPACQAS